MINPLTSDQFIIVRDDGSRYYCPYTRDFWPLPTRHARFSSLDEAVKTLADQSRHDARLEACYVVGAPK